MDSARLAGVIKLLAGILVTLVVIMVLRRDVGHGTPARGWAMVTLLCPFVAVIGLLELLSGIAAREWASHWDCMPGWLKFILGALGVLAAVVVVTTVVVLAH